MLSKNRIERRLKRYIREHSGKGYSKHAIKKVLAAHGYDEFYIDGLLNEHSEQRFVKLYTILVPLLFVISVFSFSLISANNQAQQVTGHAAAINKSGEGCCTATCQQTSKDECYSKFVESMKCDELEDCKVACCIDKEGYCLTNYLYGNCVRGYGASINRDCSDIVFCRNITDKSYSARLHNIKNTKAMGIPMLEPASGYYGSSFNIRYYLYDKNRVVSVAAVIKDGAQIVDSLALYDDGSHNDAGKNDNLYANNWDSSKISGFSGFKNLNIDIVVKHIDGSQQTISNTHTITLLKDNKCLPMSEWSATNERRGIIFAAQNYESSEEFENDARNFFNMMFSLNIFSSNKGNFNVYRLENSLNYSNIDSLIGVASSCPYYKNSKDMILLLDKNEEYCVLEKSGVIKVNPHVLFSKKIESADINNVLANLCDFVITPKMVVDKLLNLTNPIKITAHTSENITYSSNPINLSFSVSAINYPLNISVFLDGLPIFDRISNEESIQNIELNLTNGTNMVLIEVSDKNDNTGFAPLLLNATLK